MTRKTALRERLTHRLSNAGLPSVRDAARNGWQDLADVWDAAASRTHRLAQDAREQAVQIRQEGRRRVKASGDALAGRYPRREPRIETVLAVGIGVGVGAAATALARQMMTYRER